MIRGVSGQFLEDGIKSRELVKGRRHGVLYCPSHGVAPMKVLSAGRRINCGQDNAR